MQRNYPLKMLKFIVLCLLLQLPVNLSKKHQLVVKNDVRKYIVLSKFGFYEGGNLDVRIQNFRLSRHDDNVLFGFSLKKTLINDPYYDDEVSCLLEQVPYTNPEVSFTYLIMDFIKDELKVICTSQWLGINIYNSGKENGKFEVPTEFDLYPCKKLHLPFTVQFDNDGALLYNFSLGVAINDSFDEGQYTLYFHNCANYHFSNKINVSFQAQIREDNNGNFLSADEMPLPTVYNVMGITFLVSGSLWLLFLLKSRYLVTKLHYLMGSVVSLKALSLLFYGTNYYFVENFGTTFASWSALYHIFNLLNAVATIATSVLIGTGWSIIRSVLTVRVKILLIIIIPLQVMANIAEILYDQNDSEGKTWSIVFVFLDFLCCIGMLFPAFWSIRHVKKTDKYSTIGKKKLRLFRIFYVIIACYIYFTRIVPYLIHINVSFKYVWAAALFQEIFTFIAFVTIAYLFRPAACAQYSSLPHTDDEKQLITESDITKERQQSER